MDYIEYMQAVNPMFSGSSIGVLPQNSVQLMTAAIDIIGFELLRSGHPDTSVSTGYGYLYTNSAQLWTTAEGAPVMVTGGTEDLSGEPASAAADGDSDDGAAADDGGESE